MECRAEVEAEQRVRITRVRHHAHLRCKKRARAEIELDAVVTAGALARIGLSEHARQLLWVAGCFLVLAAFTLSVVMFIGLSGRGSNDRPRCGALGWGGGLFPM